MTTTRKHYVGQPALALVAMTVLLVSANLHSADNLLIAESLQQNGADQIVAATEEDPDYLWRSYLEATGFDDGPNTLKGKTFFIQSASARVMGSFDRGWIGARNEAFEKAELLAKNQLAEAISTAISSKRSLEFFDNGADMAPREREIVQLHNELSLVEKGERLMSAKLDEQLRRHFPDWDGTGVPSAERQRKIETAGIALRNEIASSARQVIRGATPMFHAEGYDDRGDYIVQVGIVWSQNTALVARSFDGSDTQMPNGVPATSIRQTLDTLQSDDPSYLAKFTGVRVWRDEHGRRVVVSAASHDRGSEDFVTERKNEMVARNRIARFAAETIESDSNRSGERSYREYADGTSKIFDARKYEDKITATVATTHISGALVVRKWKGIHPISRSPMITTVMVWTPDAAEKMSKITHEIRRPGTRDSRQADETIITTPRSLKGPSATFDDF